MTTELNENISGTPKESLVRLKAHWVSRDIVLWNITGSHDYQYSIFYSPDAGLDPGSDGIRNGNEIPLEFIPDGADDSIRNKFPHLANCTALRLPAASLFQIPEALKSEMAITVRDAGGTLIEVTGLQIPGVLDDLYSYQGALGLSFSRSIPSLRVWAPSARSVTLYIFDDAVTPKSQTFAMHWESTSGVWNLQGEAAWLLKFYLFEVEVYVPATGRIVKNLVTDPYSNSLSTNSLRSQIVDLTAAELKPKGWDGLRKPALDAPEDIVLYELHIRDFSISDQSVPQGLRGTYRAFTVNNSNGMKHLKKLAQSGLTHIHLLPAFDTASVDDDKSTWQTVDAASLASYPPDSEQQLWSVNSIKDKDGFNWGYDPFHYTTPEGSYATDPNGTPRILEFREMVRALNRAGLRVVMDVVYNHTIASGLDAKSVLDKVVPGYYHRLNGEGLVEQSSCCPNTASEHAMMRKLMIDSLLTWAVAYKVDGFRFDLMGHHMLADMQAIRAALDTLTLKKDGVDGKAIYMYGEGWNFGEVAYNARGVNAVQHNMGGTGIGVFNDRLRDAVRGGSPFDFVFEQGFASGVYFQPNSSERRGHDYKKARMLDYCDWIRISLAGNLRDYELVRANGDKVSANQVWYNGSPAGYTLDPQENVVYVSAHDNETIWDILQIKSSSELSISERVRMNNLALSLVAFSQGIPFFHAGDDLLRSKSLDRNSYNSGDWFNKLDWTYESNNWGVGLPGEGRDKWDIFRSLLSNRSLKPGKAEITFAAATFREYLQIRKSSPLFRLRTAEAVKRSVFFLNTGPWQIPGLIVMHLTNPDQLDPVYASILVLFNPSPYPVTFVDSRFVECNYELHPVQAASSDEILKRANFDISNGSFSVPERTTAVFVRRA